MATPAGQKLYPLVGFKIVNVTHIKMPGQDESVTVTAMKRLPAKEGIVKRAYGGVCAVGDVLADMICR